MPDLCTCLLVYLSTYPMKIRYYIDPMTDSPHIFNHQVTEDDVEEILARPGEDRQGYEGARIDSYRSNKSRPVSPGYLRT